MLHSPASRDTGPTIIPRSDHTLSRKRISDNALKVLKRLYRHGYNAYLAGGGVRDILLGREPKDFDIVTDATPEELKKLFRNCILIGRRFRIAHIRFRGEIIEVSTFRALRLPEEEEAGAVEPAREGAEEAKESRRRPLEGRLQTEEGLILRDNVWGTPEEDAFRRDFTVNALFYNIADFSIIDYTGGMDDLMAGRLRLIGEPRVRYREDPVRMLRAIRFAAKLGFTIESETLEPVRELKEHILNANAVRLYEELQKLWLSDEAEKGYQLMRSTGLFGVLFPEVDEWLGEEEDSYPHTFLGRAFQWIEDETGEGRDVSPALLFAILLSGPIMRRAKELQKEAGSRFPAVFPAVKEVVDSIRERISIPKRDAEALKAILYGEQRFPQMRGKRPFAWRRNLHFEDAFRYFVMKDEIGDGNKEIVVWWKRFLKSDRMEKERMAGIKYSRKRKRFGRPSR